MARVLVTGGSGFIAAHILAQLLGRGHSVVTTVRSEAKANLIGGKFPTHTKSAQLGFVIVQDFLQDGAFDKAVVSNPPFDAVIHTASPLPHETTDPVRDIVEPAVAGTVGILRSIKQSAPSVKAVVITSSFASIFDAKKDITYKYSEKDWNPVELADIANSRNVWKGYAASKKMAELFAWDFLRKEKPGFIISTINPPLVFGPLLLPAPALSAVNESNKYIITPAVTGKLPSPPPKASLWVDVRDVAGAHVAAMERSAAGGAAAANQRFFVAAGAYSNADIVAIIAREWPRHMEEKYPIPDSLRAMDLSRGPCGYDNSRSREVLGLEYRSLEASVVDTVKSLPELDM